MRHIFQNRMFHTAFSRSRGPGPVRLSSVPSPRTPDLPECGLALRVISKGFKERRYHGTQSLGKKTWNQVQAAAPYIIQKAAMAVYSDEGKAQLKEQVGYYMRNCQGDLWRLKRGWLRSIRRLSTLHISG